MSQLEILQAAEDQLTILEEGGFLGEGVIAASIMRTVNDLSPAARNRLKDASLAERVEAATTSVDGRRACALFLVRALGTPNAISFEDGHAGSQFQRKLVALFEAGAPDLSKYTGMEKKKQTVDKFNILAGLHRECLDILSPITDIPDIPSEFWTRKQDAFKALNHSLVKGYLSNYEFTSMANGIRSTFNLIHDILEVTDASFAQKIQSAIDLIEEEREELAGREDFLAILARQFFVCAREVIARIERESSARFECNLRPRRTGPHWVERRYALHDPNRVLRVKLPLLNEGPGIAIDVVAQIVSGDDRVIAGSDKIDIGDVRPGDFSVSVDMLVGEPVPEVTVMLELRWRTARGADERVASYEATIQAQNADVDWEALSRSDPYSTDVAYGDEFVGRRRKVQALAARLQKARMQSSYITGQKRVGKTSLAFAVRDFISKPENAPVKTTEIIYLEYGDYARKNADATVEALGKSISDRLITFYPANVTRPPLNFEGSLAPLNQIAQTLSDVAPNMNFVIVLDEFDEIHPEMYRYGPLAEAFFSNIRTLSAKHNFALMLVGGENMPFIIGAQGDQLNKFIREPLDYFSRSEEWDEFSQLATQKGQLPLNWHESALTELFNYTNGHPYYTKLLCGKIFQAAVIDRDAEVSVDEVQRAVIALVDVLDTNAFAHFWKDGIPSSREESEAIELKRCRLLVAVARTIRKGQACTPDEIVQNRGSIGLSTTDIVPLLTDFCRRDILKEQGGEYVFVLPLFERWLVEKGINKLIADTLGDEMADAVQQAEDDAFVSGPEILELTERWPLYRGRKITTEDVRIWLSQRVSFREQRLLYKLLKNLRFVGEEEVREYLRIAHSIVKRHTTSFTPENRSQRRYDVVITYVDGPAKSGSRYADRYAEENLISSSCVIAPDIFSRKVIDHENARGVTVNGVVIVDDIAATGQGLSANVRKFVHDNVRFLTERSITVVVVALLSTKEADETLRTTMKKFQGIDIDFKSCETLDGSRFSFGEETKIWADELEQALAKSLALEIGSRIYRNDPFGFGGLGLLVTFNDTCPNNSLPLLHSGSATWKPLFPRPVN